jgi:transglutaminase-like putative cysteine protease
MNAATDVVATDVVTTRTTRVLRVLYPAPVSRCVRQLRVFPPPQRGPQRVLELEWNCAPEPDAAREYFDEFGNRVLELRHRCIEREFRFDMTLRTARSGDEIAPELNLPPTGRGAFLLPSMLCERSAAILRRAEELQQSGRATLPELCALAHGALEYREGATDTATSGTQALQGGGGVCQDYAHLMIALCRALRIPARYVAGYNPAEGRMHAWVEALKDGAWQAWDPTHNRRTRRDCVFVACGRDFRDVAPHTGSYRGAARARLESHCQTEVIG